MNSFYITHTARMNDTLVIIVLTIFSSRGAALGLVLLFDVGVTKPVSHPVYEYLLN